jgi:excisionase family DNA binding protein
MTLQHARVPAGRNKGLVLTVEEVAEILRIGRSTAYDAINRGEIPSVRVGRRLLVPRHALDKLLSGTKEGRMRKSVVVQCIRCGRQVNGWIERDDKGRTLDSRGFMDFDEGPVCDECCVATTGVHPDTPIEEIR